MPLRGKILNTWEVESAEVLGSQEVHDIAVALGVDPGSSNLEGLRYGKVCILADADSDGAHIATLLCALFVRHFRPLVADGRVCVAMPPLYRIDVGKEIHYALDDEEKAGILKRIESNGSRAKPMVTRFKGLGEMNPTSCAKPPWTRRRAGWCNWKSSPATAPTSCSTCCSARNARPTARTGSRRMATRRRSSSADHQNRR